MAWDHDYLYALWLSTHEAEYARHLDRFKGLDAKAQGATAICGVFLAAAFAVARDTTPNRGAAIVLGIVSVLLTVALLFALWAAYVQEFEDAPGGYGLQRLSRDVMPSRGDLHPADCALFHRELAERWQRSIRSLRDANQKKSARLQGAQAMLAMTGLVATVGISIVLLR